MRPPLIDPRSISVLAILAGIAVDLLGTNVLLFPVMAGVAGTPAVRAADAASQTAAILEAMDSPSIYVLGVVLGSLASIAGGWVAARLAHSAGRLHGALSAVGCVGLGLYGWATDAGKVAPWVHMSFLVLSPMLGFLGGALRVRQLQRASPREPMGGWQRVLYSCDWALGGIAVAAVIMFGTLGIVSEGTEASGARAGALVAGLYAGLLALAFVAAAVALRGKNPRHWGFRIAGILLTLGGVTAAVRS